MGNPDAPVKLVEYASLTCPHCAGFSAPRRPRRCATPMSARARSAGNSATSCSARPTSPVTLLARCQPPAAFFRTIEQMYEQQSRVLRGDRRRRGAAASARCRRTSRSSPLARAMDSTPSSPARHAGGAVHPVPADRAGDPAAHRADHQRARRTRTCTGTPTFFINGDQAAGQPLERARAAAARGDRGGEVKGRALLAAGGRGRTGGAAGRRRRRPAHQRRPPSATGRRPSRARPKAASAWAIPTRR